VASSRGKVGKGPGAVKPEVGRGRLPRGQGPFACLPGAPLFCPPVPRLDPGFVEVYVFRRHARRVEFLALRRRPGDSLPGVWQPVTGTLRRGERAIQGALREMKEETGLLPRRLWRLETVTAFYDPRRDAIRVVVRFAAEVGPRENPRLSREHTAHRFWAAREAARRFLWDSQRRGLAAVRAQVLRGGARASALEIMIPAGRR
jgi:dihydroneopterin triphosphate diphosphatase